MIKKLLSLTSKWCAYTHIFKLCSVLLKGGDISEQALTGRNIALLGLFCPFFWFALFSGADKATLIFHATHSGIVFLIGVVIMLISLKK
jgi:hypothetical protein